MILRKKSIIMLVCALMVVSSVAFGTIAYLTDRDNVTNHFTIGDVDIKVDETKVGEDGLPVPNPDYNPNNPTSSPNLRTEDDNYYPLIPGATYTKDPTMTVVEGSEPSYVRMVVTISHSFAEDTQYLVIHGHNWHDGSMFGTLSHYRREGYLEAHPTVYLYTLYRLEEYEVVGVLCVPGDAQREGYVPYVGLRKFQSEEQFFDFVGILRENALHWKSGAELMPDDALMALSTCHEEDRIVVICRRVNPK